MASDSVVVVAGPGSIADGSGRETGDGEITVGATASVVGRASRHPAASKTRGAMARIQYAVYKHFHGVASAANSTNPRARGWLCWCNP